MFPGSEDTVHPVMNPAGKQHRFSPENAEKGEMHGLNLIMMIGQDMDDIRVGIRKMLKCLCALLLDMGGVGVSHVLCGDPIREKSVLDKMQA